MDTRVVDTRFSYAIGSRCRLNQLGVARCPRMSGTAGTIIGRGRSGNGVRVLFEGSKVAVALHKSYIEQMPATEDAEADGIADMATQRL